MQGFCDLGFIPQSEVVYHDAVGDRMLGIFHGRWALNALVIRRIMSSLPGVSGDDIERDILGYVPEGGGEDPPPWRVPVILAKAPRGLLRTGRDAVAVRDGVKGWWERHFDTGGVVPGRPASALFRDAMGHFGDAMRLQSRTRMLFQGVSAQLIELAEKAGAAESSASLLAAAAGLEEAEVADDLWLVARERMTLDAFLTRHGYHGPSSGNLASRSWREDAAPVEGLLAGVSEAERPSDRRARTRASSAEEATAVIAGLPASARPGARVAIRIAPHAARNFELTKTAFLVALDGGRAATRALGDELVADGRIEGREDAFFLMPDEILAPGHDFHALVAERRAPRAPRGRHPRDVDRPARAVSRRPQGHAAALGPADRRRREPGDG